MEIMRLIMVLAQTLKLRTVAEGVETQQHIAELKRMGCDMGQGFIFSAPLPAEEAEKLIRTSHRFRSEEHTSDLQSLMRISYAVFCLNKKTINKQNTHNK